MTPTETTVIDVPGREIAAEALSWPARAREARVVDAESYSRTAELLLGIKALKRKIGETFDPHIKRAFETHRGLTRDKAAAEAPLTEAERIIKDNLSQYDREQERLQREAQRQADELARQREEDERLERAAAMEREGNSVGDTQLVAEAQALISEPAPMVVAAPVAKATPKVAGISYRDVYKFRVTNPNLVPRQYLSVNEAAIRSVVNGLKDKANIPGVEVYVERVVAASGR